MSQHAVEVLVVDDDDAIVDALSLLLELEGFKVRTSDGISLIEQVRSSKPALILLDVWLSGQDGRELCRQLKKDSKTKNIPVILISASRNLAKNAQDVQADGYLEKPFEMERIMSVVTQFLPRVSPDQTIAD